MKKTMMSFIGAMMVLSLVACTPTTEKNKTGEVKQTTQAANGIAADKTPDPDAPNLEILAVYRLNSEGTGLTYAMEGVEEMKPQAVVDLLIEAGVLEQGTTSISLETEGKVEEVGPGAVVIPGMDIDNSYPEHGILNLNQFPADKQELKLQAVANTFMESYNIARFTIQVNGETVGENLVLKNLKS